MYTTTKHIITLLLRSRVKRPEFCTSMYISWTWGYVSDFKYERKVKGECILTHYYKNYFIFPQFSVKPGLRHENWHFLESYLSKGHCFWLLLVCGWSFGLTSVVHNPETSLHQQVAFGLCITLIVSTIYGPKSVSIKSHIGQARRRWRPSIGISYFLHISYYLYSKMSYGRFGWPIVRFQLWMVTGGGWRSKIILRNL